jgi:hypothetical protein
MPLDSPGADAERLARRSPKNHNADAITPPALDALWIINRPLSQNPNRINVVNSSSDG